MPPTKMTGSRQAPYCKSPLLFIALSLLLSSFSSAIDLTKAFGGKQDKDGDANKVISMSPDSISSDIALANAKKLVDDLNDAATGTVTSYQPGREKEPVTCNDIMAKALVVANEEKAAIIEERDSIVRAAGLLSDRVDELGLQLQHAHDKIEALQVAIEDANAVAEEKLKEAASESNERVRLVAEDAAKQQAQAEKSLQEMKDIVEETQQNAANAIVAEQEKSKLDMDRLRNHTDEKIAAMEDMCKQQIAIMEKETKIKLESAKESIENAYVKAEEQIVLKEEEVASKLAQAEREMEQVKAEAATMVEKSQKNANDKITSILSKTEVEKEKIMESNRKQSAKLKKEMTEQLKQMEEEIAKVKKKAADDMKEAQDIAEQRVKKVHDELDKAIAVAEAKIKAEIAEKEKTKLMLKEAMVEASERQKALKDDIERLKSSASGLQDELSFWKQTHESQGYCNVTLIRQDSEQLIGRSMQRARSGLDHSQKVLMDTFSKQFAAAERTCGDITVFLEKHVVPSIQLFVHNGRDQAATLYEEYLAEVVNKHVIPLYNQHIYPVYNQHIRPVYKQHITPMVKIIEKEVAVAIETSQKEAIKARSKAAELVKTLSSSAIKLVEDKEADDMLPSWFLTKLEQSSKDGESVVDTLWKGFLILLLILCRSLIYRIIGFFFSLLWFFCPLRVLVRRNRKTGHDAAICSGKPQQDEKVTVAKSDGGKNSAKKVKMS